MVSKISVLTDNAKKGQCLGTVIIYPLEGGGKGWKVLAFT